MVVDSNILVLFLSGDEPITDRFSELKIKNTALFASTISLTEILSFKRFNPEEKKETEKFLKENFTLVAFSVEIAKMAADLRVRYSLKLPDAAIAATVINLNLPLLTRDRDFRRIKELTLLEI